MKMPVLSIWQPWASLIAHGIKTIETRNDPAPQELIGQRIAVHASVTDSKGHVYNWLRWKYPEAMDVILEGGQYEDLPRGYVLATAVLSETRKTDWRDWPQTMSPVEDFWGWVFVDIQSLDKARPLKLEAGLSETEIDL